MFGKKIKKVGKILINEVSKVEALKEEAIHSKFENQPEGTEDMVDIRKIIISNLFRDPKSRPKKEKMIKCRQEYARLGHLDKPIEVKVSYNSYGRIIKMELVDKYIRILCAFEFGLKFVPVKYITV